MTRELDRFIENVGAHSSFVDVGANHGIFSLVFCALRPHGRVLAIDPSPIAFQILQTNLRLNSFASARARKIACGATAGEARMQRNWHHLEATFEASVTNPISVPVLPLDHICEEENIMPELVKIDVEGFELPVLQGAERVLRAANLLFFEVHPDAIHQLSLSQSSIFDLLASGRWRCYRLAEEDPMTRGDFIAQRNIFHTIWRRESF